MSHNLKSVITCDKRGCDAAYESDVYIDVVADSGWDPYYEVSIDTVEPGWTWKRKHGTEYHYCPEHSS